MTTNDDVPLLLCSLLSIQTWRFSQLNMVSCPIGYVPFIEYLYASLREYLKRKRGSYFVIKTIAVETFVETFRLSVSSYLRQYVIKRSSSHPPSASSSLSTSVVPVTYSWYCEACHASKETNGASVDCTRVYKRVWRLSRCSKIKGDSSRGSHRAHQGLYRRVSRHHSW